MKGMPSWIYCGEQTLQSCGSCSPCRGLQVEVKEQRQVSKSVLRDQRGDEMSGSTASPGDGSDLSGGQQGRRK